MGAARPEIMRDVWEEVVSAFISLLDRIVSLSFALHLANRFVASLLLLIMVQGDCPPSLFRPHMILARQLARSPSPYVDISATFAARRI